jgi:uncharacterized protein
MLPHHYLLPILFITDFIMSSLNASIQGFGLGLRPEHYLEFLAADQPFADVEWLEIISENYLIDGGKPLYFLDQCRERYPMVMHGVSLSIGSTDALDQPYLQQLKKLIDRIQPAWVSDHLCWTGVDHRNMHDLLPMPYTEAALNHLTHKVDQVQHTLNRPLVLENVSSYIKFANDEMQEWEFIAELTKRTGCYLLLDVNNVYVSSINHHFDPHTYINAIPAQQVAQIHLAGHEKHEDYIIDTHDHPICDDVFKLYAYTLQRIGMKPTMIERDDHIPPLAELLTELQHVKQVAHAALTSTTHQVQQERP